jgi:hypothetical protein
VLLPCVAAVGLTYYLIRRNEPAAAPVVITSQGPTIERLQHLRSLVVVRVCVADVLTADGEGYRGAWLIKGDALIRVDVGKGEVVDKDEAASLAAGRSSSPPTKCGTTPRGILSKTSGRRTWPVRPRRRPPLKEVDMNRARLTLSVEYDSAVTDPESLASALARLMETACSCARNSTRPSSGSTGITAS